MADFAAVLKKTLSKMGDTTPEARAKVYDKARETVRRQIDAMANTPPQAAIDRQFEKLETAISGVETEFAPVEITPDLSSLIDEALDDTPAVDTSLEQTAEIDPVVEAAIPDAVDIAEQVEDEGIIVEDAPVADPALPSSDDVDPIAAIADEADAAKLAVDEKAIDLGDKIDAIVADANSDLDVDTGVDADVDAALAEISEQASPELPKADVDPLMDFLESEGAAEPEVSIDQAEANLGQTEASLGSAFSAAKDNVVSTSDDMLGEVTTKVEAAEVKSTDAAATGAATMGAAYTEKRRGGFGKKILMLLLGAAVLAGGYFTYQNQDQVKSYFGETVMPWWQNLTGGKTGDAMSNSADGASDVLDENGVPIRTVTTTEVDDVVTVDDETAAPASNNLDAGTTDTQTKFTQRLTEDGTEVDEGPAVDTSTEIASAEGSSVSEQTAGTANEEAPAADGDAVVDPNEPSTENTQDAAPLVGQRAIFYEERTGQQEGTAIAGATIWSVSNESPGDDLPVEPAIRAETSVPELGLTMEMTVRRNGDKTFPASHIIELFFRVPDGFDGRGIADIQRITFKTNEQDPGNALIAVPAPLDQNIFLIALTDAQTAVATNLQLMQRENWIDIPMQYTSGRRALITFEKGAKGDEVFKQVFDAWAASPLQ